MPSLREKSKPFFSWEESHIWGKCDEWDHKVAGCELNSQYKCSAYLSEGPAEYLGEKLSSRWPYRGL